MPTENAIGYVRLSDKSETSGSIASQKKRIQEYCERYDLNLLQIFVDDGKSGWTFDRPGFIQLESFCKKANKVKYLVIPHFDRFSRADPIDAMVKERHFRDKLGVKVLQISEPPDTDTDNGVYQMMRFMQAFAANEERNRIVDRVKTGIRHKRLQGYYSGNAPYGYKNGRDESGRAIIVIDEQRAGIVKLMFQLYLKGYSITEIKKLATEKGFAQKGNSIPQRILSSCVYAGLIHIPATSTQPSKTVKGVHKPIITENQFWKVQQMMGGKKFTKSVRPEVPLRGVLRCNICGRPMTAAPSKSRNGSYYWYYLCNYDRKENYSAIKLHAQLNQILDALSLRPDAMEELRNNLVAALQVHINARTKELMNVNLLIRKAEETIGNIEERQLLTPVSKEVFNKVMAEKQAYLSDLKVKKEMLQTSAHDYLGKVDAVLDKVSNLRTVYETMDLHRQQSFLKSVFGWNLRYSASGYRTAFILPALLLNAQNISILPIVLEEEDSKKKEQSELVSRDGVLPNQMEFFEALLGLFAA
jgi:site-specific DNA recombinase